MRAWWLVVVGALACLGACAPDDTVGGRSEAIAGGERELEEPAVVVIRIVGGVGLCTGTLISPRVVLTAKHCIQQSDAEEPIPPALVTVGVGHVAFETVDYRVESIDTTPGVYHSSPETGIGSGLIGSDVAVITLRGSPVDDMPDIEPIPIRRDAPNDMVGETFTAIGFGQTEDGDSGRKFTGTGTVEGIMGNVLMSSMTICQGDSGGPMIQEGPERRVVGVASFGEAGACPSRRDGHNRVDPFLGLIDRAILESGGCPVVEDEACDSIDNDCDGTVDEGCAALGEPCESDAECAFAQLPERFEPIEQATTCEETSAGRVCTRPCDPLTPTSSCAEIPLPFGQETATQEGVFCARTEGCGGRCLPGEPGELGNAEPCETHTDCASLACFDPGDGERRCLTTCRGGAGICPVDEVCGAGLEACGGCVSPALVSGTRAIGEPCESDDECGAGSCFTPEEGVAYCTRECVNDVDCPEAFHCRDGTCRRGPPGEVGDPCEVGADCRNGLDCRDDGDRRICTRSCGPERGACEVEGTVCVDADPEPLCAPEGAIIGQPCDGDDDCVSGLCASVGGGEPACTRRCGAAGVCPSGYECRRNEDGTASLCVLPGAELDAGGGGCHVASGSGRAAWLAPIAALLLGRRRRRRRRR